MSVSRETARRTTVRAQVAAGVLLAAAGGVAVALSGDRLTKVDEPAATGPVIPAPPAGPSGPPRAPEIDSLNLTTILWDRGNPPAEEPVAVANTGGGDNGPKDPKGTPPAPGPTSDERPAWRYIGQIVGPRSTHALLERQGLQRLVAAGGEAEGTRVLEVQKDYVMVDDGTGPRKLTLAPAANTWEAIGSNTRPSPSPAAAVGRPPGAGYPGRPQQQLRPPPVPQPQPRPGQSPEELDEMRMKMEELKRQQEQSGELGARGPGLRGAAAAILALAGDVSGGPGGNAC